MSTELPVVVRYHMQDLGKLRWAGVGSLECYLDPACTADGVCMLRARSFFLAPKLADGDDDMA